MSSSILFGLMAGATWGLSFLVPVVLHNVSPMAIAFGRFFWFGVVSFVMLIRSDRNRVCYLFKEHLIPAVFLSLSGYSLYYTLLVQSVQDVGVVISSLIIGLLPITISIFSRDQVQRKIYFISSLCLIFFGFILLNFPDLHGDQVPIQMGPNPVRGVILSLVCLILWSTFSIQNSRFLKRNPTIRAGEWTMVLGAVSTVTMILIFGASSSPQDLNSLTQLPFVGLTLALGVLSTSGATWLWNRASQKLPASLMGLLIVSETIFALLYGYLFARKLPSDLEYVVIVLFILGIFMGVKSFSKPKSA